MKINMPLTGVERFLIPGRPVVTKTDLKGIVTYCNRSYIEISGFSAAESIGHSQNLVRHPDVPPEIFGDLWTTIKAGHPWRGIVKNRCKNGDHYWVRAFVTPVTSNGKITGYMSVRTGADKTEIAAAESLYQAVNDKRTKFTPTKLPTSGKNAGTVCVAFGVLLTVFSLMAATTNGYIKAASEILTVLTAITATYLCYSQLIRPLHKIEQVIQQIDEGSYEHRIAAEGFVFGVIFSKLEALRIHLRATFADVFVCGTDVTHQSNELNESMHEIAESAEKQNETMMAVSAAMEQMSVSISEISKNTEASVEAAETTKRIAETSITAMQASIESNKKAASVVASSAEQIREVNASIDKIAGISQIIHDIADQTNLLALNAAIEAARAGEHGRGFAVVADEVRKLAERTATSTIEISAAIETIVTQSRKAVNTMEGAQKEVDDGTRRVEESCDGLATIVQASQQAVTISGDISDMLRQQTTTSQEVASNMEQVAIAIDQTRVAMGLLEKVSDGLNTNVEALRRLLQHVEKAVVG